MMACVAVLGYTSAVELDTENASEAATQKEWNIGQEARDWINTEDGSNMRGLKGALEMCDKKKGQDKSGRCDHLESGALGLKKWDEFRDAWFNNVRMETDDLMNDSQEFELMAEHAEGIEIMYAPCSVGYVPKKVFGRINN